MTPGGRKANLQFMLCYWLWAGRGGWFGVRCTRARGCESTLGKNPEPISAVSDTQKQESRMGVGWEHNGECNGSRSSVVGSKLEL